MRLMCREERKRRSQISTKMAAIANAEPAIIHMRKPETGYWTLEIGGSGLVAGG